MSFQSHVDLGSSPNDHACTALVPDKLKALRALEHSIALTLKLISEKEAGTTAKLPGLPDVTGAKALDGRQRETTADVQEKPAAVNDML
eukprot:765100-Hanusia_phi.AAC.2